MEIIGGLGGKGVGVAVGLGVGVRVGVGLGVEVGVGEGVEVAVIVRLKLVSWLAPIKRFFGGVPAWVILVVVAPGWKVKLIVVGPD